MAQILNTQLGTKKTRFIIFSSFKWPKIQAFDICSKHNEIMSVGYTYGFGTQQRSSQAYQSSLESTTQAQAHWANHQEYLIFTTHTTSCSTQGNRAVKSPQVVFRDKTTCPAVKHGGDWWCFLGCVAPTSLTDIWGVDGRDGDSIQIQIPTTESIKNPKRWN